MPASQTAPKPATILAIIVLYKCELSESHTVCSLVQILNEQPDLAAHFSLLLYDNSPQPQIQSETPFRARYIHDPLNGGLATAYNYALTQAEAEHCEWLLLLDQDTSLTHAFLRELVEATGSLQGREEVAAIVPKLQVNGIVHSPATPFLEQIRQQFRPYKPPIGDEMFGVWPHPFCAYNSGSTLRVSTLRSLGGFPEEFWLDFLDHAIFHALLSSGHRVYVLLAVLVHDASYADVGSLPSWRLRNMLASQTLFVQKNGTFIDRLLYRVWLVRRSRNLRRASKDPRVWRESLRQAFLLRTLTGGRPDPPAAGKI